MFNTASQAWSVKLSEYSYWEMGTCLYSPLWEQHPVSWWRDSDSVLDSNKTWPSVSRTFSCLPANNRSLHYCLSLLKFIQMHKNRLPRSSEHSLTQHQNLTETDMTHRHSCGISGTSSSCMPLPISLQYQVRKCMPGVTILTRSLCHCLWISSRDANVCLLIQKKAKLTEKYNGNKTFFVFRYNFCS